MFLHIAGEPERLWDVPAFATSALLITTAVYVRGFSLARRTQPRRLPTWRCLAFIAGMGSLFFAIASPVDTFADDLLLAHMTQHLLLMSVAPPLIAMGCPVVPILRGLPRWIVATLVGPLLRRTSYQRVMRVLRSPVVSWLAMNISYVGWHIPAAYELALRSEAWHNFEHLCFLLTSLLFWWNILEPWPSGMTWPRWSIVPYLLSADLVNTGVSAFLCFAGRVLYPSYSRPSGLLGLQPLDDQVAAGAEMWVLGSVIFMIPFVWILFRMLSSRINTGDEMKLVFRNHA